MPMTHHTDTFGALAHPLSLGGPGRTVAVKECLDIAGLTTRCGSAALKDAAPAGHHAVVVAALLESGYRIHGTTVMHELAFGITGLNAACGTPVNPGWPDRIPGGSSSGSAVIVAAGGADLALGTDTGGSVRLPACCCGIYGLKPTFGLLDRTGAIPAASSLDCIGLFARDPDVMADALSTLAPGRSVVSPPAFTRLKRISVAADADIHAAVDGFLDGLPVVPGVLPGLEAAFDAGLVVINAETWQAFGHLLATGKVGADVAARLRQAAQVGAEDGTNAERVRAAFSAEVDVALSDVDVLVLPTLPTVPPTLDEAGRSVGLLRLTAFVRPFNLTGHPALTIPVRTATGLPAGIQLVARKGDDARLCAVAQHLRGRATPVMPHTANHEQTGG